VCLNVFIGRGRFKNEEAHFDREQCALRVTNEVKKFVGKEAKRGKPALRGNPFSMKILVLERISKNP
jgi:hypothetical protein